VLKLSEIVTHHQDFRIRTTRQHCQHCRNIPPSHRLNPHQKINTQ
jgi:hypothetical protein